MGYTVTFQIEGVTPTQAAELFDLANTAIHDNIPVGAAVVPRLVEA